MNTPTRPISVKIYYYSKFRSIPPHIFSEIASFGHVTKELMEKYHVLVYEYEDTVPTTDFYPLEYIDRIYTKFNKYEENPLSGLVSSTNQKRIEDLDTHTSMSIGDIIQLDQDMYTVTQFNFVKIE